MLKGILLVLVVIAVCVSIFLKGGDGPWWVAAKVAAIFIAVITFIVTFFAIRGAFKDKKLYK